MEQEDYVVLRRRSPRSRSGVPGRQTRQTSLSEELGVELARMTSAEAQELWQDPAVAEIAPKIPITVIEPFSSSAQASSASWGIAAVGAEPSSDKAGRNVSVAVLDTGINRSHPAFSGVESWVREDFTGTHIEDKNGHGTHCAGTIFGRDVDGTRIGIARGVRRALIGKVLNDDGRGTSDMLFDGLLWAIGERAQVISMSLGFDFTQRVEDRSKKGWPIPLATSAALHDYAQNLRVFESIMQTIKNFGQGAVVVAATGNNSKAAYRIGASLPAAAEGIMSVGALQREGDRYAVAEFSNTFPRISAPGVDIVSANHRGGLKSLSGTSMACPHVAGVAVLWWERLGSSGAGKLAEEVTMRMLTGARSDIFTDSVKTVDRGYGLVTAP